MITRGWMLGGLVVTCLLVGCSSPKTDRKPTFPVTGEVHVDGQPAADLAVVLNPVAGLDKMKPTVTQGMTGPDGKFVVSTYDAGDGAPVGEYKVTFTWGKLNPISMTYDNDRLNGKYAEPEQSTFTIKVEQGKPVDMGKIELKTN